MNWIPPPEHGQVHCCHQDWLVMVPRFVSCLDVVQMIVSLTIPWIPILVKSIQDALEMTVRSRVTGCKQNAVVDPHKGQSNAALSLPGRWSVLRRSKSSPELTVIFSSTEPISQKLTISMSRFSGNHFAPQQPDDGQRLTYGGFIIIDQDPQDEWHPVLKTLESWFDIKSRACLPMLWWRSASELV